MDEDHAMKKFETQKAHPQNPVPQDKTLQLLAQWREEDATEDLEELERRDAELEEFKSNLQKNRI